MRILLDTSAYSAFKRNHAKTLLLIRRSEEVLFSSVVAGELLAGFRWVEQFEKNLGELLEFLENPRVALVPVTLRTADRYGRIYASLRTKGTPIPSNDMWVAAQCLETGAELATMDKHFRSVEGLVWTDLN